MFSALKLFSGIDKQRKFLTRKHCMLAVVNMCSFLLSYYTERSSATLRSLFKKQFSKLLWVFNAEVFLDIWQIFTVGSLIIDKRTILVKGKDILSFLTFYVLLILLRLQIPVINIYYLKFKFHDFTIKWNLDESAMVMYIVNNFSTFNCQV